MPEVYRFDALKEAALKAQGAIRLTREEQALGPEERARVLAQKERLVAADYFLWAGLDLKGRTSIAYAASGAGLSAEAAFNPFGLVGLNTGVSVGAGFKGAKQRSVIATRGPTAVVADGWRYETYGPLMLSSFIGMYGQANVQVGIDVGIGFSASLTDTGDKSGVKGNSKTEGQIDSDFGTKDDKPDTSTNVELCAIGFEAKAGFKASVGYTYEWAAGIDPYPIQLHNISVMRNHVADVLEEGSTKTVIKKEVCQFITKNAMHFGNTTVNLHNNRLFYTSTTGHKDILKILRKYEPNITAANVKRQTKSYIELLSRFEKPSDERCFLVLSSHQPEGQAGLYASAEGKVHLGGVWGTGVSAEVFAGVKGQYKRSYARYQAPFEAVTDDGRDATIMVTYDTMITYKSFYLGLNFDFDADYTIVGHNIIKEPVEAGKKKLDTLNDKVQWKPDTLNRMTYRTAIVVWKRPPPLASASQSPRSGTVDALKGSGVAIGESYVVENLRKMYERTMTDTGEWKPTAKDDEYVKLIAITLEVKPEDLLKFLKDAEVREYLQSPDWLSKEMGVLLEATFALPTMALPMTRTMDSNGNTIAKLDNEAGKKMFQSPRRTLESIRLRYRKRDLANDDSTLFTVGFKIAGNGFKIKLQSVKRAGADGIIDLRTVFMGSAVTSGAHGSNTNAYEDAVPAAVLFCQ